jgi:hypothetical protein
LPTLLRREGWGDNHKRVFRIYQEEHLQVSVRNRKRTARWSGEKADACLTIPLRRESGDSVSTAVAFGGLVGGGRAFNDYGELLYDYLTIRFDGQDVPG